MAKHTTCQMHNRTPEKMNNDKSQFIQAIHARQIYDSRGKPTLEVEVSTQLGTFVASVPSGASTGKYEACELRDNRADEFLGSGVTKAIDNVNNVIAPSIVGRFSPTQQKEIDQHMVTVLDGTPNKSKLGANAILGVSLAVARAGAAEKKMPLYKYIAEMAGIVQLSVPLPFFNVINGGRHAGNEIAIQEFMLVPTGAKSFYEAMRIGSECYHHLKMLIKSKYGQDAVNVGDEGGFAPNLKCTEDCLELIVAAIKKAGYESKVKIALDCAASEFFSAGNYDLNFKSTESMQKHCKLTGVELIDFYQKLKRDFPIFSIEDPFDEDDYESWSLFTQSESNLQIIGDDLTVTNVNRIKIAAEKKSCNCLLLKVNQIGTLTEAIDAVKLARSFGWNIMTSHRSGETEDSFIADLAVGLNTQQIKSGAPCRSERLSKYNRLLKIEQEIGTSHFKHPFN